LDVAFSLSAFGQLYRPLKLFVLGNFGLHFKFKGAILLLQLVDEEGFQIIGFLGNLVTLDLSHHLLHIFFLFLQVRGKSLDPCFKTHVFVLDYVEGNLQVAVRVLKFLPLLLLPLGCQCLLIGFEATVRLLGHLVDVGFVNRSHVAARTEHNVARAIVVNNLLNYLASIFQTLGP